MAEDIGDYIHETGVEAAIRLLDRKDRPDAVFCANDLMAFATIEVARERLGLRIPQDVAVVGYDNSEPGSWPLYQLTSVDQHVDEMARLSVDLLLRKLAQPTAEVEHLTVPARLVARGTTRAA